MKLYLPKGRLYSLMAVNSATLKSTFIASKSCQLLLLYVTHCSVSKVGSIFHIPNRLSSLTQKLPHTFIKYICSWQYFICTKFTRCKHKTDVPIKYWHIPEWWYLVIWVKNRSFGAECSGDSSNIMHNLHKTQITKSTIKELQIQII